MKRIVVIVLLMHAALANSYGQDKKKNEVEKAVQELHQAMINADSAALSRITSPMLEYVHSSGAVDRKDQFIDKIVSGKSDFVTIKTTEQSVTVTKKTAIVRHILIAETNDSGKPGNVQLRIMLVWHKEGGRWKLLARQAAKML